MPKKRHKPEEMVVKLQQVDVLVSQGQSVDDARRPWRPGYPASRSMPRLCGFAHASG
jgi:hypothetical protein